MGQETSVCIFIHLWEQWHLMVFSWGGVLIWSNNILAASLTSLIIHALESISIKLSPPLRETIWQVIVDLHGHLWDLFQYQMLLSWLNRRLRLWRDITAKIIIYLNHFRCYCKQLTALVYWNCDNNSNNSMVIPRSSYLKGNRKMEDHKFIEIVSITNTKA